MSVRVPVQRDVLTWAQDRSGIPREKLARRFPKLREWEDGAGSPTLKQLEQFASVTRTPIGFFFLAEPPDLQVGLPDFRTRLLREVRQPSPELLDTVYLCELRQDWYRRYVRSDDGDPLSLVGSVRPGDDVTGAADTLRDLLGYAVDRRPRLDAAFRHLADAAEDLGILVMVSEIAGSDTSRKLNPDEFQGFALCDQYAPVVFVNGADTRAAQSSALAHELVHIWAGQSGLDDADPDSRKIGETEQWCNAVAAEFLVPARELSEAGAGPAPERDLDRLAEVFRVSTLVILLRLRDVGYLPGAEFRDLYAAELRRVRQLAAARRPGSGGSLYRTVPVRASKRFTRAVITSTLEGKTLYKDAFRMLGFRRIATFNALASNLGIG